MNYRLMGSYVCTENWIGNFGHSLENDVEYYCMLGICNISLALKIVLVVCDRLLARGGGGGGGGEGGGGG